MRRWLWLLALLLREGASLAPGGARGRHGGLSARFASSRSDMGPRPKRPKLKESFIDREERKAAKKWSNMEEKRKTRKVARASAIAERDAQRARTREAQWNAPPRLRSQAAERSAPSRASEGAPVAPARAARSIAAARRFKPGDIRGCAFEGGFGDEATGSPLPSLGLPEVAFIGRSNVGKSSMLNALAGVRKAAAVSKTPGRTQQINLFRLSDPRGDVCALADLPGYGYAKISKAGQAAITRFLETYFATRRELRVVVLIVDVRREPQDLDVEVLSALRELDLETIVVATKIDKLRTSSELLTALGALNAALALPDDQPFIFSAETAQGRPELWSAIQDALVNDAEERRR